MSKIQWTGRTSNIFHLIRSNGSHGGHFCRKVSAGCLRCYSEAQNQSNYFSFASHLKYSGGMPSNMALNEGELRTWLTPKKETIFVNSMTDTFLEEMDLKWQIKMLSVMALAPQKTFQILTKRPKQALACLKELENRRFDWFQYIAKWLLDSGMIKVSKDSCRGDTYGAIYEKLIFTFASSMPSESLIWLPENIWVGVSAENQECANQRIPILQQIPAHIRFLSCEPLLEEINIVDRLNGISWVIVGGESGADSRPCHIDWVRSLVNQCKQASVAPFVKQLGSNCIASTAYIDGVVSNNYRYKTKDRKGGNIEEFPEDLQIREMPKI